MLTREQIRAAHVIKPISVDIPEWNGSVFVREITAAESLQFAADLKDQPQARQLALQLAMFLCDENGKGMYTAEEALVELVTTGSSAVVKRIIEAGLKANGIESPETIKGNS